RRQRGRPAADDRRQDRRAARIRSNGDPHGLHPGHAPGAGRTVTAPEGLDTVFVEAPARLHFGVLDLRGSLGRWFGGIGAAAPEPTLLLSARLDPTPGVEGADADRAEKFARAFLAHHDLQTGARISIHRALPPHAGLGSGTQLALAVARAIAELHGLPTSAAALAGAVGRAQRSAVGTWTFD